MKAIVDTCIIIDAMQSREPFFDDAQNILIAEANGEYTGILTSRSLMDIYYIVHKYHHNDSKARDVIATLARLFEICDTTAEDAKRAIASKMTDYEDAVMAGTAIRTGADVIITRNVKDYRKSKVRVIGPSDFLELLDRKGAEK